MVVQSRRAVLFLVVYLAAGGFVAALTRAADAACYSTAQALPAAAITAFRADATQILQQNPGGGPAMISRIRDLAASDPATLPIIVGLLVSANSQQKIAIGTGLGQAAQICIKTDQAYAAEIQRLVAGSGSNEAITALAAVIGDRPIGALGSGVGGPGVSTGAGGPVSSVSLSQGGSSTLQTLGSSSTRNNFTSFTAPGGATPGSTATTNTTTTITRSVSP